ncbi:MAG TPA: D-2-hydroxyacid dehydrogenase [Beutenbergiaceae bacterium]|nr:D-2-hydroxyacid dehydrogenase [Beutenbergiaceae bacterium]
MNATRPVGVVLTEDGAGRPPQLTDLDERMEWRFTDAAGLPDALRGAQVLMLWDFFSTALRDAWPHCDALQWIHVTAAGVDSLLFDELRASEVVITNARGTFDRPIAEFVLASVLAHAKRLHESWDLQRERTWRHRETLRVQGRRALVVGTGAIGREIAGLLRAAGLQVQLAGRSARADDDFGQTVASADLIVDGHFGAADYVINAAPLTDQTRDLFDAEAFAAMGSGAHFINIGRGPSVVEEDLAAALHSGALDGASLDVFRSEPLPAEHPLWHAPGAVISAHMSGDVVGWREVLAEQFTDNLRRWLDAGELVNVVDKELGFVSSTP